MNVTLNKTDAVNAVITVEVEKADYAKEVENSLKDLRKNAVIAGFRKGMVPVSFLRQKYGKSLLAEELNKLVSKTLSDYIPKNIPNILGEPLPPEKQDPIDFDNREDFVFTFDIGLSPAIDVRLTKDDTIPYYLIQVSDEMIDKQIENLKAQYGSHEKMDDVEDNDLVKGRLIELDENGEPKPGGISIENAVLIPKFMKEEEEKTKFLNAKLHSTIIFNPYKAYEGNESELASFLHIKKEEAKNYTGDFSFEILEITRYKTADLNRELFDIVFEPGTVNSEESFRKKLKEGMALQLVPESDYRFILDARKLLEEKASNLQFPDTFLKRWLLASNSKRTPESVEEEYPKIRKNLTFQLIRKHLMEENGITVEENELHEYARRSAIAQFAQYGMPPITEDSLEKYCEEMLKKEETYRALVDKAVEDKLLKIWKKQVKLEFREITIEEFQKLTD